MITSNIQIQLSLDSEIIPVEENANKCSRVIGRLSEYDQTAVEDIGLVLRCDKEAKEQTAFEYIRRLIERKTPIRKAYHLPEVIEFNNLYQKVTSEIHRMKGFLRFIESTDGILYAPFTPDNNITDLLMPHFADRFCAERFVIHDLKRKIAGIYNNRHWVMGQVGETEIFLSENERAFETLWKKYYRSVNIAERPHEKQMRGYMPARYWKHLPEKEPEK